MIKFKNIHITFCKNTPSEKRVVHNLSEGIGKGEFITIIGSNGAGKSTLLAALTGEIPIDKGEILVNGKDISKIPSYKRAKFISKVSQDPMQGTFANLTVEENLIIAYNRNKNKGLLSKLSIAKVTSEILDLVAKDLKEIGLDLKKRLKDKVVTLSGGQRQVLSLIMATMGDPAILLLDEHTAALDPETALVVMRLTRTLVKKKKLTAIMVTHCLDHIIDPNQCLSQTGTYKPIYDPEEDFRLWIMSHGIISHKLQMCHKVVESASAETVQEGKEYPIHQSKLVPITNYAVPPSRAGDRHLFYIKHEWSEQKRKERIDLMGEDYRIMIVPPEVFKDADHNTFRNKLISLLTTNPTKVEDSLDC